MPRGTTQVVTRCASNDWCQMCRYEVQGGRASVRGTVAVRGVDTSVRGTVAGGGWTNKKGQVGTGVCQYRVQMRNGLPKKKEAADVRKLKLKKSA
ncbi:hypothetical protein Tco_0921627 [Tanacetum coccineum]